MKTIKKYTLAFVTATSFIFVGCSNTPAQTDLTATEIMQKVQEQYSNISSINTNMTFNISNNSLNETMSLTLDMQTIKSPMKVDMTMEITSPESESPMSISLYMDEEYLYMNFLDNWMKQPITDEMKNSLNIDGAIQLVNPLSLQEVTFERKEDSTLNEKNVYVITATIDSSILESVLSQSTSLIPSTDSSSLDLDFSTISDLEFDYYIDKENYAPLKVSTDLSDVFSQSGEEITGTLDMTFDQINSLTDIPLPDGASNATDLSTITD